MRLDRLLERALSYKIGGEFLTSGRIVYEGVCI